MRCRAYEAHSGHARSQDFDPALPLDDYVGVKALREVATKMAFLDDTTSADNDTARRAVQLMTLHKAKGLEFSVVVLVGLDEAGIFPRGQDSYDFAQTEQQKNMVYVGVTRTRNLLVVSGVDPITANAQMRRGSRWKKGAGSAMTASPPSIFLNAMYRGFGVQCAPQPGGSSGYPCEEVRCSCLLNVCSACSVSASCVF